MSALMYPGSVRAKARLLARAPFSGVFCQLGSAATVEVAARAGFDCVLLDQEHGLGGEDATLAQLVAVAGTPCVPIVRLAVNEAHLFKRALDLGATGIMVPMVEDAAGAARAVAAMHYPPRGVRGLAKTTRATGFGASFDEYFEHAWSRLLLLVQVESARGVAAAADIAAVEGVDCLFVGPTDLGCSLAAGAPLPFDDARLVAARRTVAGAARAAGKAAGILCATPAQVDTVRGEGFTVVFLGSDMAAAAAGLRDFARALAV